MCLQCKKLRLAPGGFDEPDGIPAFLARALTPPHPKSIANALESLVEIGAMEEDTNDLTDLGRCLSVLSLEPRVGKMVSEKVESQLLCELYALNSCYQFLFFFIWSGYLGTPTWML
jgi:HrpA-like RNA helicase